MMNVDFAGFALKVCFLCAVVCGFCEVVFCVMNLSDEYEIAFSGGETQYVSTQSAPRREPAPEAYGYSCEVSIGGHVDSNFVKCVESSITTIPPAMLEWFNEDGWGFVATDDNLHEMYFKDIEHVDVVGATVPSESRCYISNLQSRLTTNEVVWHEFGHYIDSHFDVFAETEEWLAAYYDEGMTFWNSGLCECVLYNERECFAESFRNYYESPKKFRNKCPRLYYEIDRLLGAYIPPRYVISASNRGIVDGVFSKIKRYFYASQVL